MTPHGKAPEKGGNAVGTGKNNMGSSYPSFGLQVCAITDNLIMLLLHD